MREQKKFTNAPAEKSLETFSSTERFLKVQAINAIREHGAGSMKANKALNTWASLWEAESESRTNPVTRNPDKAFNIEYGEAQARLYMEAGGYWAAAEVLYHGALEEALQEYHATQDVRFKEVYDRLLELYNKIEAIKDNILRKEQ